MDKNLFTILKDLQNIQPNSDYSKQSRFLILSLNKTDIKIMPHSIRLVDILSNFQHIRMALTAIVFAVLIISSGTVYYINKSNYQNNLIAQADELNNSIQIKLNKIKYLLENKNSQLNAENISDIQILLDQTANELKNALILSQNNDRNPEKSLEKIKSAQEILLQVNAMLED